MTEIMAAETMNGRHEDVKISLWQEAQNCRRAVQDDQRDSQLEVERADETPSAEESQCQLTRSNHDSPVRAGSARAKKDAGPASTPAVERAVWIATTAAATGAPIAG